MSVVIELSPDAEKLLNEKANEQELDPEDYARLLVENGLGWPTTPIPAEDESGDFWNPLPFDELARRQGIEPIVDFQAWLASVPHIPEEGANGFYEILDRNKREARETERRKAGIR